MDTLESWPKKSTQGTQNVIKKMASSVSHALSLMCNFSSQIMKIKFHMIAKWQQITWFIVNYFNALRTWLMDMPPDLTLSSAFFMSSSDQCTAAVLDSSIPTFIEIRRKITVLLGYTTGWSNWILYRIWNYCIYCLRDVILKIERDLSNIVYNTVETAYKVTGSKVKSLIK